jgi:hypothetical protein
MDNPNRAITYDEEQLLMSIMGDLANLSYSLETSEWNRLQRGQSAGIQIDFNNQLEKLYDITVSDGRHNLVVENLRHMKLRLTEVRDSLLPADNVIASRCNTILARCQSFPGLIHQPSLQEMAAIRWNPPAPTLSSRLPRQPGTPGARRC